MKEGHTTQWPKEKGQKDKDLPNIHIKLEFITTYAIQSVPISTNVVSSNPPMRGVLDTILFDKVYQCLATCR